MRNWWFFFCIIFHKASPTPPHRWTVNKPLILKEGSSEYLLLPFIFFLLNFITVPSVFNKPTFIKQTCIDRETPNLKFRLENFGKNKVK